MVDINQSTTDNLNQLGSVGSDVTTMFSSLNKAIDFTESSLIDLSIRLKNSGVDLKNISDPASLAASKFGLIATAVVGATDSFKGLAGVDLKNLSTFTDQLSGVSEILSSGVGGKAAEKAINGVISTLSSLGVPMNKIKEQSDKGTSSLLSFAGQIFLSADNALRMQSSLIQLTASTGNLGSVLDAAGADLNNMNSLLFKQSEMLSKAGNETGLGAAELQQYWAQLGHVPGTLEEMTTQLSKGSTGVNLLSATVQMATGTGRAYSDVINDMKEAVTQYGLSSSQALTFTARIAEVSQKFKAPMEDVRSALIGSSQAFKMFADSQESAGRQSESISKIMNTYVGALKDTGLSAHNAVALVEQMTNSMSQLTMVQKSFLSAQTGGPGGLRGGFQIEGMLEKGETDKVFDKVRQMMKKQMGPIVSRAEAEASEPAAQRLQKQMLLLQQMLPSFAKTDQEAIKILEGFKAIDKGKITSKGLSDTIIQDQMKTGKKIEETSKTPMSQLKSTLEGARYTASISNLGTLERALSARTGINTSGTDTAEQKKMRDNLKQSYSTDKNATVGTNMSNNLNQALDFIKTLPNAAKASFEGMKQAIMSGSKDNINEERKKLQQMKDHGGAAGQKVLDMTKEKPVSKIFKPSTLSSTNMDNFGEANAGALLESAAQKNSFNTSVKSKNKNEVSNSDATFSSNKEQQFYATVHVAATCSVCKHNLETSAVVGSINSAVKLGQNE